MLNLIKCCLLFPFILDFPTDDTTSPIDPELVKKIHSLRERLRDAEFQNSARSQELISLKRQLSEMVAEKATRTSKQSTSIENSSRIFFKDNEFLELPSIYNFMPHLMDSPLSLKPALHISRDRQGGEVYVADAVNNNLVRILIEHIDKFQHELLTIFMISCMPNKRKQRKRRNKNNKI